MDYTGYASNLSDKTRKYIERNGDPEQKMNFALKAYSKGLLGEAPDELVGSDEKKALYNHAYNDGQSAKAAFNNAVNDGEDTKALYKSWKEAQDELGMKEAELEALANSGIGKQVPQIAKQLEEEAHREAEEIQTEKAALFEKLEALRRDYMKVAYQVNQKQQRQGKLMQELDNVRKVVKGIEPIKPSTNGLDKEAQHTPIGKAAKAGIINRYCHIRFPLYRQSGQVFPN